MQDASPATEEAPSANEPSGTPELANALASGLLLVAIAACGRILAPWLFFIDDFQAYFLPGLLTVGRMLRRGELPLLTPTTWAGGNIVGEYQYAIFNPFVLVLSVVSSCFHSLDAAALSIVLPTVAVVGFAVHHAARSYDIDTSGARTAAVMVGLGNFLLVWCASSWIAACYSFPWVVLFWSFLHRYVHREGAWYPWVLCLAGVLTSGWPFAVLAAATVGLLYLLGAAGKRAAILGGAAVGVLLGAIAILPLVGYLRHGLRASQYQPDMWRVTWDTLVTSFVPLDVSFWQGFDEVFVHADRPIAYLNVFLLFLVPAALVARLRGPRPAPDRRDLERTLVVFLLLVGLPPPSFFRWPFRYLPFLHVFLSLACLRWWTERRRADGPSRWTVAAVVAFGIALTVQQPQPWDMVAINAAVLAGAAVAFARGYRQTAARAATILCGYTAAVFLLQMYWYQDKTPLAVWGVDERVWASASPKQTLSLFTSDDLTDPQTWNTGTIGNVNLLTDTPAVNGYSPVKIEGTFGRFFTGSRHSHLTTTAPDIIERLKERAPGCEESWLGVLGVERLLVFPSQQALVPELRKWLSDWNESRVGNAVAFESVRRPPPFPCLPADLSAEIRTANGREVVLGVTNRARRPRRLILRRQWFPGYRAWLNGVHVPVRAVGGVAVGVAIPAGGSGRLVVRFAPESLGVGVLLFAAGILGLLYGISRGRRPAMPRAAPPARPGCRRATA